MAIDTRAKRASVAGLVLPFMLGVHVDSTKPVAWRQAAGWSYSGIAASSAEYLVAGETVDIHWRTTNALNWRTTGSIDWRSTQEIDL